MQTACVCRESLLKLQASHDSITKQVAAAKSCVQANHALKKEVADLRFRVVMAGSNAPADARTEWGNLKDDLVRQLQAAEASVAELQGRLEERSPSTAEATGGADAAAELERVQHELQASQAAQRDLETEAERLRDDIAQLSAGAHSAALPACSS